MITQVKYKYIINFYKEKINNKKMNIIKNIGKLLILC